GTPAAFGRRCIPTPTPTRFETRVGGPGADCVVLLRESITDDVLGRRAATRGPRGAVCAPWGARAGRLAALVLRHAQDALSLSKGGATLAFYHALLAWLVAGCGPAHAGLARTIPGAGTGSPLAVVLSTDCGVDMD